MKEINSESRNDYIPVKLQLKQGETLLGDLEVTKLDWPWVMCSFAATNAFKEIEPFFEAEIASWHPLEKLSYDEAKDKEFETILAIRGLGLTLINLHNGQITSVTDNKFLMHIHKNEAWFRHF